MSQNKERNVFYVTHSMELLLWLIIILFVVIIFSVFNFHHAHKNNKYTIFMPDVDGLIVGSPVRAMGIEIGHVIKIEPTHNDEVYVRFIITDKTVELPQGTVATVEFSGMAGSKSLELYMPDEKTYIDSSVPLLSVSPPKRLHDAVGLLNDMFKRIGDMIYTASSFGSKLDEIKMPKVNSEEQNPEEFLKYSNEVIDRAEGRAENLRRSLENVRRKK